MRTEFFLALFETTKRMMEAYTGDHSFMFIIEHERTQLAVIRKACKMTMDQMMAAYNAATRSVDDDDEAFEADEIDDNAE